MKKTDVIAFFGGSTAAAEALGYTRQAVWKWKRILPKSAAYRVQVVSKGKLKVDPKDYQ